MLFIYAFVIAAVLPTAIKDAISSSSDLTTAPMSSAW